MIDSQIYYFLRQRPSLDILYIGLSGGMDSVALLHALVRYRAKFSGSLKLIALHIHHGLNPQANDWANFCRQLCADWQVEFHCQHVKIKKKNLGIEAAARQARYTAFAKIIGKGNILLAHHAHDQMETLLINILRGGGLRALVAMPQERVSGSLNILRPLLHITRSEIEDYIKQNNLSHIHDTSNDNTQFLRNWVRHNLLPHIAQRVPSIEQNLLQSIAVLQDELTIINNRLDEIWQNIYHGNFLARQSLQLLNLAEQKAILLKFCREKQLGTPIQNNLNYFVSYLNENPNKTNSWSLPNGEIWAYRDKLWSWHNTQKQQYLMDTKIFSGCLKDAPALNFTVHSLGLPDLSASVLVRPHRKSDFIETHAGKQSVTKILQNKQIPIPARKNWPVIEYKGKCVAVVNVTVCRSIAVANGWLPEWALTQAFVKKN